MVVTNKVILGGSLFVMAHILSWFQLNMQFMNPWWKNRGILAVLIFGIPCGLMFWYGWKYTTDAFGRSLWSARFISFGLSYLTFPIMTHYFLGESMFTSKTMICAMLSFLIIFVQISH